MSQDKKSVLSASDKKFLSLVAAEQGKALAAADSNHSYLSFVKQDLTVIVMSPLDAAKRAPSLRFAFESKNPILTSIDYAADLVSTAATLTQSFRGDTAIILSHPLESRKVIAAGVMSVAELGRYVKACQTLKSAVDKINSDFAKGDSRVRLAYISTKAKGTRKAKGDLESDFASTLAAAIKASKPAVRKASKPANESTPTTTAATELLPAA